MAREWTYHNKAHCPMPEPLSILVVDDELTILQTLGMILKRAEYSVTTAQSCAEALSLLKTAHFDVVITDLSMEKEDIGFEVVREAQRLKSRPVIVVCTGYANKVNSRVALNMGVDYLALKPVEIDELTAALRRLLHRRGLSPQRRTSAGTGE
ncbi:MAG TPA: response regulator [Terriglobales bacterium]|nr:response regulator [Terriglobales bacterium]